MISLGSSSIAMKLYLTLLEFIVDLVMRYTSSTFCHPKLLTNIIKGKYKENYQDFFSYLIGA